MPIPKNTLTDFHLNLTALKRGMPANVLHAE